MSSRSLPSLVMTNDVEDYRYRSVTSFDVEKHDNKKWEPHTKDIAASPATGTLGLLPRASWMESPA